MKSVISVITAATLLLMAAPAQAAEYYVDQDADNTHPADCPIGDPCNTTVEALGQANLDDATVDTVHVGRSATEYMMPVSIPDTPVTLLGGDYDFTGAPAATTVLDGGPTTTVTFDASVMGYPRTVRGFVIQGGTGATLPNSASLASDAAPAGVTIAGNTFNEDAATTSFAIYASGGPTISGNRIEMTETPAGSVSGIFVTSPGAPQLIGNVVSGAERSIHIDGDTDSVLVSGNTLQPAGDDGVRRTGIALSAGAGGSVIDNLIAPAPGISVDANGIYLSGDTTGPGTRALSRNRIFSFPAEGLLIEAADQVTLDGDVIAGNGAAGLANRVTATSTDADNVTVWGNDTLGTSGEISLITGGSLSLDSSIVGDDGVQQYLAGAAPACTATFSRGPVVTELCGPFSTTATPSFLSQAQDRSGFRLSETGNSTLIDQGNPAAAAGVDLDGNSLLLNGAQCGTGPGRRDIGADEVAPAPCAGPPPVAGKKCPKGKRLKRVKTKSGKKKLKCVKKKKRKK